MLASATGFAGSFFLRRCIRRMRARGCAMSRPRSRDAHLPCNVVADDPAILDIMVDAPRLRRFDKLRRFRRAALARRCASAPLRQRRMKALLDRIGKFAASVGHAFVSTARRRSCTPSRHSSPPWAGFDANSWVMNPAIGCNHGIVGVDKMLSWVRTFSTNGRGMLLLQTKPLHQALRPGGTSNTVRNFLSGRWPSGLVATCRVLSHSASLASLTHWT